MVTEFNYADHVNLFKRVMPHLSRLGFFAYNVTATGESLTLAQAVENLALLGVQTERITFPSRRTFIVGLQCVITRAALLYVPAVGPRPPQVWSHPDYVCFPNPVTLSGSWLFVCRSKTCDSWGEFKHIDVPVFPGLTFKQLEKLRDQYTRKIT